MTEPNYRIQYAEQYRFAQWSEWRPISEKIKENSILSCQFDMPLTREQEIKFSENFKQ
jgi:hypothetical protein